MKILINSFVLTFLLVSSIVRADGTREIVILDGVPVYFDTMFKPGVKPERVLPKVEKQPDPIPQKVEEVILTAKQIPTTIESVKRSVSSVTDQTFAAEVENYKGTILVDFSATWCGPCQRLSPTVDEMAEKFKGKIKVVKIDVDSAPNATRKYSAYAIPMLVMIKNGNLVDSHVGAPSREYLESWMLSNSALEAIPASFKTPVQPSVPVKPSTKPFDSLRGVIIYNGKPVYKDTIDQNVPEVIENYPGSLPSNDFSSLPTPQPVYQDAPAYRSPPPFFGGFPVNYNATCVTG